MVTRSAARDDYESYLVERLQQSLHLAEIATSDRERAIHLRSCRYYCDLLGRSEVPTVAR